MKHTLLFFKKQNKAYCHWTAMHYGLFPLSSVWRAAKLRQWPGRVQTVRACRALKQSARSPRALQMFVDLENEETKRYDGKKKDFLQIMCHPWTVLTWLVCRRGGTNAHAHKQTDATRCDGSTATGSDPMAASLGAFEEVMTGLMCLSLSWSWIFTSGNTDVHMTVHTCNTGVSRALEPARHRVLTLLHIRREL